jgi:hypothetical protein
MARAGAFASAAGDEVAVMPSKTMIESEIEIQE